MTEIFRTTSMMKRRSIVLDTAALIAGTDSLYALGGIIDAESQLHVKAPEPDEQVTFYTTPDVIQEVRDPRARQRLALLQGGVLVVRPPSSEALDSVISFAKATGDFSVLSLTDLRVMALCWMLEIERDGGQSLRKEPQPMSHSQIRIGKLIPFDEIEKMERELEQQKEQDEKLNDGWTTVETKEKLKQPIVEVKTTKTLTTANSTNSEHTEKKKKKRRKKKKSKKISEIPLSAEQTNMTNENDELDDEDEDPSESIVKSSSTLTTHNLIETVSDDASPQLVNTLNQLEISNEQMSRTEPLSSQLNEISSPSFNDKTNESNNPSVPNLPGWEDNVTSSQEEEEDDTSFDVDDGIGWINPNNLEEHLAHDAKVDIPTNEENERVGCVTTDFAMQNTMLQMGLKILTVDGRRTIRKIKHFALRCSACGVVTRELSTKFCDACGNFAMHRVAFNVSKNGVARAYLNPKKTPNLRGTKYPIPKQRGGRYNRDLILRADQIDPVKQKRIEKRLQRQNVDVLDPTTFYNAGARFNPNERPMVIGYGRRNPNEVRRNGRKKR